MNDQEMVELQLNVMQEIRRGVLVLAALNELHTPKYGYSLLSSLSEKGLEIDQGTLYPLLRRLESQGWLHSEWNVEGARPRRYYVISQAGRAAQTSLVQEWRRLTEVMEKLLS